MIPLPPLCPTLLNLTAAQYVETPEKRSPSERPCFCDVMLRRTAPPAGLYWHWGPHVSTHTHNGGAGSFFLSTELCFLILLVCDTSALYVVLHTWRRTFVASVSSNVDRKYIDDLFHGIYAFQFWFYVFVSVFICLQLANKWAFVGGGILI